MRATGHKDAHSSEQLRVDIDWKPKDGFKIDPAKPAKWKRSHDRQNTKGTYELLDLMKKHSAEALPPRISVVGMNWLEFTVSEQLAGTVISS